MIKQLLELWWKMTRVMKENLNHFDFSQPPDTNKNSKMITDTAAIQYTRIVLYRNFTVIPK
jgi:hypothetical protein